MWRLVCFLVLIPKTQPCVFTNNNCLCIESFDEMEYQCPKTNPINRIVMHVKFENDIQIDCYNLKFLNISVLPNLNIKSIENFFMQRCPLPKRNFNKIFRQLGLNETEYFNFDYHSTKTFSIDKSYFKGFQFLKGFSWDSNNLLHLKENLLENTPNLIYVDLKNSQIELTANFFKYTPYLILVELSQNNLTTIPIGLFSNLHNLTTIQLWENNIEEIHQETFDSLYSLITLELSSNQISRIHEKAFADLHNLIEISLQSNKLKQLPENLFRNNKQLKEIRLGNNFNLQLPNYLFSSLKKLESVSLDNVKLDTIPENLFNNLTNLNVINLGNNRLKYLPEKLFYGLGNLSKLLLDKNFLTNFPNDVFSPLKNLEVLNLQHNLLTKIDENLLKNLQKLEKINFSFNDIKQIETQAFVTNQNLLKINLANNKLSFKENEFGFTPFTFCKDLEYLDLSNNLINDLTSDLTALKSDLKHLDLSHNQISTIQITKFHPSARVNIHIYLSYNKITTVNFGLVQFINNNQKKINIYLDNNPINCDCHALDLVSYFYDKAKSSIQELVNVQAKNLTCASPVALKNQLVQKLSPKLLTCPLSDWQNYTYCPDKCCCFLKPHHKAFIVDCANKNLTTVPDIILPNIKGFNHTEVYLDRNYLREGPSKKSGYKNVTNLFLSGNQIKNLTWLPPNIEVLKLDQNNISTLDDDILDSLSAAKLRHLSLGNNPFICDCSAINLTNFLRKHMQQIDISNVKCTNAIQQLLVNLNESVLCQTYFHIYVITLLVLMLVGSTLVVLYCLYRQQIKVWLYSRNLCLWWVSEEELDKDKIFDAFISYSHKDEDFVREKLLEVLENGPEPYKLCLHYRNWIPGEFIAQQIVNSVKDSRRTIVVLSQDFLKSVWSKMEFRTAHTEAMSEGRARVIVILYGDVDMKKLDREMKTYLETNTYVKWGDPWFWEKLKYALPHSKKLKNSRI